MTSPASPVVFALDTDNGSLRAFESAQAAAAHCKGVDVHDGYWRFFADDGSPLEARFERPAAAETGDLVSNYTLQRAMSGLWLQERLAQVSSVAGCELASIDELEEILRRNRGKRIPPNPIRR